MGNLIILIIVNVLAALFIWLTIKHYRALSRLLKDSNINNNDVMSIRFLDKIFHANPERPDIRKQQKKVIRYAVFVAIMLVLSKHLFFQFASG